MSNNVGRTPRSARVPLDPLFAQFNQPDGSPKSPAGGSAKRPAAGATKRPAGGATKRPAGGPAADRGVRPT